MGWAFIKDKRFGFVHSIKPINASEAVYLMPIVCGMFQVAQRINVNSDTAINWGDILLSKFTMVSLYEK